MKIPTLFVALSLVCGTATAQSPGSWIEVSEGAWTPDEPTISKIATSLQSYAQAIAKRQDRELRPWSEYSFQYQGRVAKGRRYVYVLGLCKTVGEPDLRASFYEVIDGGTCFFGLTFDAGRQRVENFRFNTAK